MLTVSFPAQRSYFIGEDAIIRKYKFWDELKSLLTRKCYPFPIVYNDGLISYVASDGDCRTPYGFAIGDYIIPFVTEEIEMSPAKARFHCKKVIFASIKGELPPLGILRYIRSHLPQINKVIDAFDGNIFKDEPYLSSETCGPHTHVALNFASGMLPMCHISNLKGETTLFRPVINIAHLY